MVGFKLFLLVRVELVPGCHDGKITHIPEFCEVRARYNSV